MSPNIYSCHRMHILCTLSTKYTRNWIPSYKELRADTEFGESLGRFF